MKTEFEIIKEIGYKTQMEFVYMSDSEFTFKTFDDIYEVSFYIEKIEDLSFFKIDSFNFLLQYQISEVKKHNKIILEKPYLEQKKVI